MLTRFICPDGQTIPIQDCLTKCRMSDRCASKPYLLKAAEQRAWTGIPSCTQLQNGTRLEYLKITTDYSIKPEDVAFALAGTIAHDALNGLEEGSKEEERLANDIASGKFDNYSSESGTPTLTDYKFYGAYAVNKVLQGDSKKETLQMNFYRLLLEGHGFPVKRMVLEMIVRDYTKQTAKQYKLEKKLYRHDIKSLPDEEVRAFFKEKKSQLLGSLILGVVPPQCSDEEAWGGRRCAEYCQVKEACKKVGNTWLK